MIRYALLLLTLTLVLTSCGNDSSTDLTTEDEKSPITIVESNESENTKTPSENENVEATDAETTSETETSEIPADNLAQQNEAYEIESQTVILSALNTALTMPQISGLSNSSIEASVNELLSEGATAITDTLDGTNPVTITYTLYKHSPSILSIVYEAEMTAEDGTIIFWNPVNIHIPSATLITSEKLLNGNRIDISKYNALFSDHVSTEGFDFDMPEDWMGFYMTDDAIVYFLKESDLSELYTLIPLTKDEINSYLNVNFKF